MQKIAMYAVLCVLTATPALCWEKEADAVDIAHAAKDIARAEYQQCDEQLWSRRKRPQECAELHTIYVAAHKKWLAAIEAMLQAMNKKKK